jgi:SAM-dependent methyltransferase
MTSTLDLYGEGLLRAVHGRPGTSRLRIENDRAVALDIPRWVAPADGADETLLSRCTGPTLDIGCGPGRLTRALQQRGICCTGIDVAPVAVELARAGGVPVLHASVFADVLDHASWQTVLLADGNIGIGGDPVALLRRCHDLLVPGGCVLVEVEAPGSTTRTQRVRLETSDGRAGAWFPWSHVGSDDVRDVAEQSGLLVGGTWHAGDRWFADLRRAG